MEDQDQGQDFIVKPTELRLSFNKIVTTVKSDDEDSEVPTGPFEPVVGGTVSEEELTAKMRPILKSTEHPIMIDLATLDLPRPNKNSLGKEELAIFSTIFEKITLTITKAIRQARGTLDILTFPQASSLMEPLSRLKATFLIIIEAITLMGSFNRVEHALLLNDIGDILTRLGSTIREALASSGHFLDETKSLSDQSEHLFRKKKEFHVQPRRLSKVPIYSDKVPENVTLYEDVIRNPYVYEGVVTYGWGEGVLTLYADLSNAEIDFVSEDSRGIDDGTRLVIIHVLIDTANDLLTYSAEHLREAISTLDHPIFKEEFPTLVDRLALHSFDPLQDPLSALELKTHISEMRQKQDDLINIALKIQDEFHWVRRFVDDLDHFTKTHLLAPPKNKSKTVFSICICTWLRRRPPRRSKWNESGLIEELGRSGRGEISLSYPMNSRIQTQVFKINCSYSVLSRRSESEARERIGSMQVYEVPIN